jgi:hypothetical protein
MPVYIVTLYRSQSKFQGATDKSINLSLDHISSWSKPPQYRMSPSSNDKKPVPYEEPRLSDSDNAALESIKKSIERAELLSGIYQFFYFNFSWKIHRTW